ncbi:chromate resistance protein [Sphingobium sp. BHU LFT2]|uniref:chromate resistance protein ChrB domain-containing protein n=1 Tax=Sphingobium sp. BHU LFT2 TaxID=2807634 RepID=UPI001BE590FB|nr:chromate resistance protein ChrB domain-containing protein [Sphingobium sp. BHU LFT2]MBT2246004.1 chromate resistance protein [Sphingobium sp. BHU LFT2]
MIRATPHSEWIALLHQLPTKPPYLRVKIWRRLQGIGAVAIKNAVHVLPKTPEHESTFLELLNEIVTNGGEAILIDLRLLAGMTDGDVQALFDGARDTDYDEITQSARRLLETGPASGSEIARLQNRMGEVTALDYFGAPGRRDAETALEQLDRQRYEHPDVSRSQPLAEQPLDLTSKVWVTRSGVHVDRIACAWLIRRFVDPEATFKFVDARSYLPGPGELRFDMAEAEFTHEEDRCSFETIVLRAGLTGDPALVAIGEIIHDLDIADGKFNRPETPGLGAILSGVCASSDDDLQRIAQASEALNQFHTFFSARNPAQ